MGDGKTLPGVSVLTGVSEDEAIRAVQRQIRNCSDETAQRIARKAWNQVKKSE